MIKETPETQDLKAILEILGFVVIKENPDLLETQDLKATPENVETPENKVSRAYRVSAACKVKRVIKATPARTAKTA